jgi:uncharacterized protein (TIGR03663 family)
MKRTWALGFCLIAVAGLALRCVRLDNRPMHNDEAVNAIKLSGYWQEGHYRYDPNEHHGPTLYYSSLPLVWLSGTRDFNGLSEFTMRLTPVLFGVGLIFLLWPLAGGLGRGATLVAALLTALSPAMVFYSRYYIHEMLLVFFSMLVFVGGWRYAQSRKWGWAVLTGAGLGLMFATKETFVFSVVAMIAALFLTTAMDRGKAGVQRLLASCKPAHLIAGAVAALVVALVLFTSFFTNLDGPLDSVRTYLPWLKRAGGASPHIHPWHFYFERLAFFHRPKGAYWSEGLILVLAAVGMFSAFAGNTRGADRALVRFLTFYTLGLMAIYTGVSYKTPWCMTGFLHGLILLAGVGMAHLTGSARTIGFKAALWIILVPATGHLGWEAWQASFVRFADWRNPYVYAQTVPDTRRLVEQVQKLARVHPDGNRMVVKVIAPGSDYWPLPYDLRNLTRVGWYDALPEDPYAPVVVTSSRLAANLDEKSGKRWLLAGLFELRPKVFLELYVEVELWKAYVVTLRQTSGHGEPDDDKKTIRE